MALDYKKIAQDLYDYFNLFQIADISYCMTRLRLKIIKSESVDIEKVKSMTGVLGVVVSGNEFQVILGPGVVSKVYTEFVSIVKNDSNIANIHKNEVPMTLKDVVATNKEENKKMRQNNVIAAALSKFAKIFTPLIPAFIAAGILSAVAGIIQAACGNNFTKHIVAGEWYTFFTITLSTWQTAFLIIFGYRFSELFGGKGWIGAVIGALYTPLAGVGMAAMYNHATGTFLGIHIGSVEYNWFTSGLAVWEVVENMGHWTIGTPHGSIFGIMLSCILSIYVERYISKIMNIHLDTLLTPTFTMLIILVANFLLIFPLSGYIFVGMSWLFKTLTTGPGAPFGDMFLAVIFIFAVLLGVHQGFIPIYVSLINSIGINTLFPVLALAGATQVGGAICMYAIAKKNGTLRKQIIGTIVPGILGVAEPLLYGVSLPRIVPLVSAAIGAAIPGFVMGAINAWGHIHVGLNTIFGPAGILSIIMMTSSKGIVWGIIIYLSMIFLSYISGFFSVLVGYKIFKNSKKINWNLE